MKESDIRSKDALKKYFSLVRQDAARFCKDNNRFEKVPCVACGSKKNEKQFKKMGVWYVQCGRCRTMYANPRPTEKVIEEFNIHSRAARFWTNEILLRTMDVRRRNIFGPRADLFANKIRHFVKPVVADIGAGPGIFLEEVTKRVPKARCIAIEPSPGMSRMCREKGIETVENTIEAIMPADYKFDALSAFELLEHLREPAVLFKKASRMLKPGGLFLFTTLNCEGFDVKILWENSKNIYPLQHINFFNPYSITILLKKNGFAVEEISTPGKLDWDIVENTIKDGKASAGRFWEHFAKHASGKAKTEFQQFLSDNLMSSHMMVWARKKYLYGEDAGHNR